MTKAILKGTCMALALGGLLAAQMPKTTTERIQGQGTSKTEQLRGTVVQVEGGTLAVKMSTGEIKTFTPPESRRFIIDGQELSLRDLKPGTRLTATIVTTQTPVTERTTTVGSGTVWFVSGRNVILTLPNGENRQYQVRDDYRFNIEGNKKATVSDLRKGMVVKAEKIVEVPRVEIATDTRVTGSAPPPPKPVVAQTDSAPTPAPAPRAAARPASTSASTPASAAEPAPAPVAAASAPKLPKTGSPVPLIGLMGLLCGAASLCVRRLR